MRAYWSAFQELDEAAVGRVFPSANLGLIRKSFAGLRSQQIVVADEQVTTSDYAAVVTTSIRHSFVPKVGVPGSQSYSARFELRRTGNTWVIVSRR